MKLKKLAAFFCAAIVITKSVPFSVSAKKADMRDITTMELVREMGIGINLGNTYDSFGDWIAQWGDGTPESYETAWGSPVITQEIIQGYADEGFGVLRVPVAWSNMMSEDYTISKEYLSAVRETVDWALNCDLYVILNLHYDNGWFSGFSTDREECMKKYTRIWKQLSEAFQDYDDHLMFESLNEEGCWADIWNHWSGEITGKEQAYSLLNDINQTFVDIMRSSSGNNPERHLLIAGYGTDIDMTCDELFEMPEDPENRCAVSVHYYTPSVFAILEEDADWGKVSSTWGTDADFEQLNHYMDKMKTTFIDKGIPVIVGEYGCPKKNKDEDSVRLFLTSVCKSAYDRQLCPILWDITGLHYNRDTCRLYDPQLRTAYHEIVKGSQENVYGDVNHDGKFSVADVLLLQKWLLAVPDVYLADWKAGDLCEDDKLDVFDLCLMKRELLKQKN